MDRETKKEIILFAHERMAGLHDGAEFPELWMINEVLVRCKPKDEEAMQLLYSDYISHLRSLRVAS